MMPPPTFGILTRDRGSLYLTGADIDFVGNLATDAALNNLNYPQDCVAKRIARDGILQHMTLLSRKEISSLVEKAAASCGESASTVFTMLNNGEPLDTAYEHMNKKARNMYFRGKILTFCESFLGDRTTRTSDWFIHGIGRHDELHVGDGGERWCFFLVCSYPRAAALRKKLGLPPKDFHITLGFNEQDIHDCAKGVDTLLYQQPHSITATSNTIISTPRELVLLARTTILGGQPDEKIRGAEKTDNTASQKGKFHYASILIGAAERMISVQNLQRKPFNTHTASLLLELLGNSHHQTTLLVDFLEIKCQILGRAKDFEDVVNTPISGSLYWRTQLLGKTGARQI